MGNGQKGTSCEGRPRVVWSRRGQRRWCPGAGRSSAAATTNVSLGWTSYLHWQTVVDALRGRREGATGQEDLAQPPPALPHAREVASQSAPPRVPGA